MAEHISSFLLHIRRCAEDKAAGLVLDAAPPGTGTGVAVDTAPGAAVPVAAAGLATNMDVDTADDLFADIHDFDPTSGWGDDDEVTAAMSVCGDAEVTTTATTDAVSASVAGADRAVEPLLARQRCGNRAHRGRDDLFADVDDFDPTWSGVVVMRPQQRGRV